MRYLHFGSVRGDLQEGHGCSSRCQSLSCRAQNRGFCVRMCDFSEILGRFDTKSAFLYAFGVWNPRFRPFRAQHRAFCAREEGKVASVSLKISIYTYSLFPMVVRRGSLSVVSSRWRPAMAPRPATNLIRRSRELFRCKIRIHYL